MNKPTKIYRSRWYVTKIDGSHITVYTRFGSFTSYTRAMNIMYESEPEQPDPRYIAMWRKAEFIGFHASKGKNIIEHPNVYRIE